MFMLFFKFWFAFAGFEFNSDWEWLPGSFVVWRVAPFGQVCWETHRWKRSGISNCKIKIIKMHVWKML